MHLDPRPQLPNPGANLQNLQTDRIELGPRPRRPLKVTQPQGMQKHIGHGMKEEPELIGLEPVAGSPVGEKVSLMVFDHQFHPPAVAVNHLVNDAARPALQVRHHEPEVHSQGVVFGLDDDPARFLPACRSVGKLPEEADRLALESVAPFGFFHQRGRLLAQHRVRRQPQGILQVLRLAELDNLRRGVMRIGPQQNPHPRPGFPDFPDHPLDNRHDLLAGGPFARPQDCRPKLPAFPLVEVNRQITILIVEGVEKSHLLMAMSRIFGSVNIEDNPERRSPIRVDEDVHQHVGDAVKICPRNRVLQPGERRLAGQRRLLRKPLASHLQGRVLAQRLGVIGVLVAASDLENPLLEQIEQRMPDVTGMAAVVKDLSHTVKKPHPALDFPKEEHAGVGRDLAAVKVDFELFFLGCLQKEAVQWYDELRSKLFPPLFGQNVL